MLRNGENKDHDGTVLLLQPVKHFSEHLLLCPRDGLGCHFLDSTCSDPGNITITKAEPPISTVRGMRSRQQGTLSGNL